MLVHHSVEPTKPRRTVILGANGFLSQELRNLFGETQLPYLAVGSKDVDLVDPSSTDKLAALIKPEDVIVFVAALTPDRGRSPGMLMKNLRMGENVCGLLEKTGATQMIYISSDGIYDSRSSLINEDSPCETGDLYAISHIVREKMLAHVCQKAGIPLAMLRPSSIYGSRDTHNSYGPNRFMRTALADGKISLFGGGEEQRDHIFVRDVAQIVLRCARQRSAGVLNAVTGRAVSFRTVADTIIASLKREVTIVELPRSGPVTHRHFDITALVRAFPDFQPTALEVGISQTLQELSTPSATL